MIPPREGLIYPTGQINPSQRVIDLPPGGIDLAKSRRGLERAELEGYVNDDDVVDAVVEAHCRELSQVVGEAEVGDFDDNRNGALNGEPTGSIVGDVRVYDHCCRFAVQRDFPLDFCV